MRKNGKVKKLKERRGGFERFARAAARTAGRPATFGVAMAVIAVWACFGPVFHFSDTWQLVINTGTTIITFLMVFLIQNTQNRDSEAMQLKLDELIRASGQCHNAVLDIEDTPLPLEPEPIGAAVPRAPAVVHIEHADAAAGPVLHRKR